MDERARAIPEAQAPILTTIDQAILTPLVQRALNKHSVEVNSWEHRQLHAGVGAGSSVFRFAGQARDQHQSIPWSLILKVLQPERDNTVSLNWNYYKREAEAYRSGWLNELPGCLAAPRCFGITEHADGTCWIWLEELADEVGPDWSLEQYGVVARHVGQFNGAYLVGQPIPAWPWLSSGWLRHSVEDCAPALAPLRDSLDHPLVRRWLPGTDSDRLFRLWAERAVYLDALDRLPQTLCHLDIFPRNIFRRCNVDGDQQTVAIDWAFSGTAAIGEELVPLILGSVIFEEVGLDEAPALEKIVFEGYLDGLRDVGWQGDPRQVRLGYAAAATLRYQFNDIGRWLAFLLDENADSMALQSMGRPVGEVLDHVSRVRRLFSGLSDEAWELIDTLELLH